MPYKILHVGKASTVKLLLNQCCNKKVATVASEDMPFMQRSKPGVVKVQPGQEATILSITGRIQDVQVCKMIICPLW